MLPIDTERSSIIEDFGARLYELDPIGAIIENLDLAAHYPPPDPVLQALEYIMACRGFIVFKSKRLLAKTNFFKRAAGGEAKPCTARMACTPQPQTVILTSFDCPTIQMKEF